jgi:D-sedoheptulose 7-phosphate isomerase
LGAQVGCPRGARVVAITRENGGAPRKSADLLINVPSQDSQQIQEGHITIEHILCALVERHHALSPTPPRNSI